VEGARIIMIAPYLHFKGSCEEAFNFYVDCFGGGNVQISRFNGDPNNPVMHAMATLNDVGTISGADDDKPFTISGMEILAIFPNRERVEEVLAKISIGANEVESFKPHPPPDDKGGGAYVVDKYGYSWFLCC
jgi:PhnB protein